MSRATFYLWAANKADEMGAGGVVEGLRMSDWRDDMMDNDEARGYEAAFPERAQIIKRLVAEGELSHLEIARHVQAGSNLSIFHHILRYVRWAHEQEWGE